jgi:putative ABC transport system permease protein
VALQARFLQRLRSIPGVVAAAPGGSGRPDGDEVTADAIGDVPPLRTPVYYRAGPGFFATMGIPLVRGRDISESDENGGGAVVLSETAARRLFPHGGAIGRMVKLGDARSSRPWLPVVGIAKDISLTMNDAYDPDYHPGVFADTPYEFSGFLMVARVVHGTPDLTLAIRRGMADLLPADGGVEVVPWTYYQQEMIRVNRFFEQLLSMLGTGALLLGVTGLFSVLSYGVGQRMREFAVRQALGATPLNIVRVVLKGAFEMALGGTAVGALLSFWASAGLSSVLFGVKNTDPVSLVIAEATLMAVALAAALVPAVRAMRSNPVDILRST